MDENAELKRGDRVIFHTISGSTETGVVERTLPRVIIIEFDHLPGKYFQVSRDRVEKK